MDPVTLGMIGSSALGAIGAGLSGSQQPADGNLHLVNANQDQLYRAMLAGLQGGGGDFGYGTNVKQGTSQLAQMMAARGISPSSGVAAGAYGNMLGQAESADQQARRQYMMQLLGTPLQTATFSGNNYAISSPSYGSTKEAQFGTADNYIRSHNGFSMGSKGVAPTPAPTPTGFLANNNPKGAFGKPKGAFA